MTLGPKHIGSAIAAVDSAAIVVQTSRCAKVRNRNVNCLKCADACTTGCISFEDGQLNVAPERCVGCGTCATVCPTCALEARNPTDAQLHAKCAAAAFDGEGAACASADGAVAAGAAGVGAAGKQVCIACSQAVAALEGKMLPERVAQVVCAGRVEESLLAGLAAEGVGCVHVLCGNCQMCEQKHGLQTAQLVAQTVHQLFDVWGVPCKVEVTETVPAYVLDTAAGATPEVAQAALAAYFETPRACAPIRSACEVADAEAAACAVPPSTAQTEPEKITEQMDETHGTGMRFFWNSGRTRHVAANLHVMKDGTLPHFLPDRRERLLDALAQFGTPEQADIDCRLWGSVVIDGSKCSSCRMCATFCPTGAIAKFDSADGTMGVMHYPADCVKCASCYDICPEDAIILNGHTKTHFLMDGTSHKYNMTPREISLRNNPHQMLETMRHNIPGDNVYER